jgi:predicted metal-dependent RNase
MWWNWVKIDYGVRVGLAKHTDLTIEHAKHIIVVPVVHLHPDETLVTLRVRI